MNRESGFTVIEILVAIAFLIGAGTLFYMQRADLEAGNRDTARKTAINAMYYNLEEVYYTANNSYPSSISSDNLKAMDKELFKDPNGVTLGDQASNYRYEPSGCDGNACKSYILRADLEREGDFIKNSLH